MSLVALEGLSYWYPGAVEPALDTVSIGLERGLTLVTGSSGSGKSTLLRVLDGLVPHHHGGRLRGGGMVAGMPVPATPTRVLARRVGFVFQDPEVQVVHGVVEREVAFGLENLGLPAPAIRARVEEALDRLDIASLRHRRVETLSGGERQRVALAGALALRPALVVLDEPTSQLDATGAAEVAAACAALARDGVGVVVAEQRLDRFVPFADSVLCLAAGRMVPPGPWLRELGPGRPPAPASSPGAGVDEAWRVHGATFGFARGEPVVTDLDAAGGAGEVVGLTGPNGSGKTTLLRLIAGLVKPWTGSVERRPGRAAYLPQDPTALLHRESVRAEVELTLRLAGAREPARGVLADLGLAGVADRYPRDLSAGEKQRAALAAILAGSPSLALLDEPTRGMDPASREGLVRRVRALAAAGTGVVIATHDERLLADVADRVTALGACAGAAMPAAAPA